MRVAVGVTAALQDALLGTPLDYFRPWVQF